MKKPITVLALLLIILTTVKSQGVAINTDGSSANASAMLDIKSTDKGMLAPRMTQSERDNITSPATGLFIYQIDNIPGFYYYNGSAWVVAGSEALDINSLTNGKTAGNSVFLGSEAGANNVGMDNKNMSVGYEALISNTTGTENTANGFQALYSNTTGVSNTANGVQTLYFNITGNYNTSNGYQALVFNTTGVNNTANGFQALFSNTTGYNNTATGYQALYSNTIGYNNTATGYQALYSNNSGVNNTASGNYALLSNTTGYNNTADGYHALFSNNIGFNNTACGTMALFASTTGYDNTAVGANALYGNTTGFMNTAVGSFSLRWNETGNYNTAMGYESGPPSGYTDLENTTAIGYLASPTASNRIHIGNTSVTWIGGQVTWSTYSDSRAKNQVKEDVIGLDFIMKLRPVTWYWDKDKLDSILGVFNSSEYKEKYDIEKIKQSGFLAQEVEIAAKECGYDFSGVHAPINENTPYSISYATFVVPLVKAVQEQQEMSIAQKQKIEMIHESFNNYQELTEAFQEQMMVLKQLEKLENEKR